MPCLSLGTDAAQRVLLWREWGRKLIISPAMATEAVDHQPDRAWENVWQAFTASKQCFTYSMRAVIFDAKGPKSGRASSSLWFSFLWTYKKPSRISHHMHDCRGAWKSCVVTQLSAVNTRHTYNSRRCRALENKVLSSTCSLLWLRSLQKKRQKLKESIHWIIAIVHLSVCIALH